MACLYRMAQRNVKVEHVAISSTCAGSLHDSGCLEVTDHAKDRPLRNSNHLGHLAHRVIGVLQKADQNMGMIGEEGPIADFLRGRTFGVRNFSGRIDL